jgi:hypothetical protein
VNNFNNLQLRKDKDHYNTLLPANEESCVHSCNSGSSNFQGSKNLSRNLRLKGKKILKETEKQNGN